MKLVAYMRDYSDDGGRDVLLAVFADMMKRGKWGGIEIGFCQALSEVMIDDSVRLSSGRTRDVIAMVQPWRATA